MITVQQIKFNALVASANYQFVSAAVDHTNIPHELEDAFMHAYGTMLTNVHVGQAALPAVLETWIPFSATPELLADFFTRMGFAVYIPMVQTMLDGFKGADLEIRTGGYLAGMDTAAQTIVSEEYHYNQNGTIENLCHLYKLKHTPVWASLSEDFKRQVVKIQAEKAQHFLPLFETFKTGLKALQAEMAQVVEQEEINDGENMSNDLTPSSVHEQLVQAFPNAATEGFDTPLSQVVEGVSTLWGAPVYTVRDFLSRFKEAMESEECPTPTPLVVWQLQKVLVHLYFTDRRVLSGMELALHAVSGRNPECSHRYSAEELKSRNLNKYGIRLYLAPSGTFMGLFNGKLTHLGLSKPEVEAFAEGSFDAGATGIVKELKF